MDLGITTFLFLILNCFLSLLGIFRIVVGTAIGIWSIFLFTHYLKEVTFASYVSNALLTGLNEVAIFILGITAGNKNSVRFLNTYQILILLLIITKVFSVYEMNKTNSQLILLDVDLAINDVMNDQKTKMLPQTKADEIQRGFHCCGIQNYTFWIKDANKTELPRSCCSDKSTSQICSPKNAWKIGCMKAMHAYMPNFLLKVHYYTMFPVCEVVLFFVGILLIILVMKTASNSLA